MASKFIKWILVWAIGIALIIWASGDVLTQPELRGILIFASAYCILGVLYDILRVGETLYRKINPLGYNTDLAKSAAKRVKKTTGQTVKTLHADRNGWRIEFYEEGRQQ